MMTTPVYLLAAALLVCAIVYGIPEPEGVTRLGKPVLLRFKKSGQYIYIDALIWRLALNTHRKGSNDETD